VNTLIEHRKVLRMSSVTVHVLSQTIYKTLDSFVNWTCGKLFYILYSATFDSEIVLGFG